jgi:hypothetical protein
MERPGRRAGQPGPRSAPPRTGGREAARQIKCGRELKVPGGHSGGDGGEPHLILGVSPAPTSRVKPWSGGFDTSSLPQTIPEALKSRTPVREPG